MQVQLQGATVHRLPRWSAQQGAADLAKLLASSQACRASAATHKHDKSSRSHAIYRIILYSRSPSLEAAEAAPAAAHDNSSSSRSSGNENSNIRVAIGRLTLVDLAGSERGSDRGEKVSKERLAESVAINKSLSALRDCMKASDAFHTGAQAGSGGVCISSEWENYVRTTNRYCVYYVTHFIAIVHSMFALYCAAIM